MLAGLSNKTFIKVSVKWSYKFFPEVSSFRSCLNSATVAIFPLLIYFVTECVSGFNIEVKIIMKTLFVKIILSLAMRKTIIEEEVRKMMKEKREEKNDCEVCCLTSILFFFTSFPFFLFFFPSPFLPLILFNFLLFLPSLEKKPFLSSCLSSCLSSRTIYRFKRMK